jgi:CubicO group peptidase (beta-lactamase class C family)
LYVLLLAVLPLTVWLAREGLPPVWVFQVHRAITTTMSRDKIPGLSIAVVTNGKLRWASGYGLADVENRVPATAQTVYRWASVSKPVTAVAVLQLAERGQLQLDERIQSYVPDFPEKAWPVTARRLLGHLGGVRHYQGDESRNTRRYETVADALKIFRDDPLISAPGTKHSYTTFGYNVLGAAIEGASKTSYLAYVHDHVFRPAGMITAQSSDLEGIIPRRARGYVRTPEGALKNSRPIDVSDRIPGGGLCGTVEDMARFAAAVQSGVLLSKRSIRAMFTRQETSDGRPVDYGLGWNLSRRKGREEVWHSGHQNAVSTMLYMLPDRRFAVALAANLEHVELRDLAGAIADAIAP